ncbi:hypothetical protein R3X27_11405 [Tropicimonas sp. TH_r6]|uniref:methyltransferase domain-containing protein n=1 Tax=Tropicimonas sp. TH_r6 TaxID=3082085 RepID=UPI00295496F4|nr:methyltransferase domain-containing protein [Tropicimonas sp. TH_r6]MDV7143289.1 hypothetical protein [Tropicimonas sp. TH_r6]
MRETVFEALAPVCPRCLHGAEQRSPLVVADRLETRADHLWHGTLHCSNPSCWLEFPVIDGIPIIVADPAAALANAQSQLLRRDMLPAPIAGVLADALGAGGEYDLTRQHLSLYAGDHFADWAPESRPANVVETLSRGFDILGEIPDGPAIDLGGSVGRGGWELSRRGLAPVVVADLNIPMMRLGQALALEGHIEIDLRRVGVVYDRVRIDLPEDAGASPDFWAIDAMMLPFTEDAFSLAAAINLVDCVANPTAVLSEMARTLAPGAGAILSTPYDWAPNATEISLWLGGHSQRGPTAGASEPILRQTLLQAGLPIVGEVLDAPWRLRMHARAVMEYSLHLLACRRDGGSRERPFS